MKPIPTLLLVVASVACANRAREQEFPPIGSVDHIVVVANYGRDTLPVISDSARVASIVAFANRYRSGWGTPWAGVPVPRITAAFFHRAADKGAVQYFGAGPRFFEASSSPGDFSSRSAEDGEIAEFLHLIGAPANAAAAR
jgi:hypothetical protein